MSNPPWHDVRMKLIQLTRFIQSEGQTIAIFGRARLVKKHDGKFELIGGSRDERADALEWVSLFLHEAVISR